MADAILNLILQNLTQLAIKEAETVAGVNGQLQSLSHELELMQAFLKEFEWARHENEAVDKLVNQIRDVAYDAEDVMEEYVASAVEYMQKWTRFLPGSVSLTAKRKIGKRIAELQQRTKEIYANRDKLGISTKPPEALSEGSSRRPKRAPIVEEDDVVGFKKETEMLVSRLIGGDTKRSAVCLVGMGGLGKTTLAKKIYNDSLVKDSFKHRAWVYVSQENTREGTVLGILKCLTKVTDEMKEMNDEEIGNVLLQQLKGKKYLIAMDDVWDPRVWEELKPLFPDDNNGSRIMFTTRVSEVAVSAIADRMNHPHYLRKLDDEESWELFRKKALLPEDCSPQWEHVGRKIAEKCGGLPLALVVLGSLLSLTPERFDEWEKAASRVSNILSQRSSACKDILALSYKELPHELKACFIYIGVFPEDHQIPARQLIQLWVAEGFIRAGRDETMEDTAERYLNKLVDRNLIQVLQRRSDGGVKTCSIHDLLRDLCISEAAGEAFLEVHGAANSLDPVNPRRLSGNGLTTRYISNNASTVKQLRSFLCFTKSDQGISWSNLFQRMRYLRVFKVVDLGGAAMEIENLPFLRYLGLGANSYLTTQSSVANLFNLQILDARSKSIRSAPDGFWKLDKLRHTYFEGPAILPKPKPSSTDNDESSLKNLQTLSTISANSCTPQVFRKVPNLLKLGVQGDLNAISGNLETLERTCTIKLARVSKFPPMLSLPPNFPPKLTKLTLCDTQLEKDPIPLLSKIPKLQTLKMVSNVCVGRKMVFPANGFAQLQILKVVNADHVREILIEKGSLLNLDTLVIHDCQHLGWLTGARFLTALQVVDLRKPSSKLRQTMQKMNEKSKFKLYIFPLRDDEDDESCSKNRGVI